MLAVSDELPILLFPLLLVASYALGSIPFAWLLGRARGVDLRAVGTGNAGAGNLTKTVGLPWGAMAAILDGVKGLVPVFVGRRLGLGPGAAGMLGLAVVLGHNWSLVMRGRAGRGLAPSAGMMAVLDPVMLVWASGWAVAGWRIGGGLGGFVGWGFLPVVAMVMRREPTVLLIIVVLSAILLARRMQGNLDRAPGIRSAFRRAVFDADLEVDEPAPADNPLTS